MKDIGLRHDQCAELVRSIQPFLERDQRCKIWVFGSRAKKTHQPHSDLDILLVGVPALNEQQIERIRDALEESELPFKVDVVVPESLNLAYAKSVADEKKLLVEIKK